VRQKLRKTPRTVVAVLVCVSTLLSAVAVDGGLDYIANISSVLAEMSK